MKKFKGKRVTVMGIGLHGGGVETIKWFLEQGAKVIATDLDSKEKLQSSLNKLKNLKNLKIVTGQHRPEDFSTANLVIKNPAISWDNKYIRIAKKNHVAVETDSSIFFQMLPQKTIVVGITGSKGKTTTALLIYEILKKADKKVIKVGIGQEPVLNKLKFINKKTIVVFEMSSWRLSALKKHEKSPQIAVITNIYPDHLNYYKSMDRYIKDKKYIFAFQKRKNKLILNWDNSETRDFASEARSEVIFQSVREIPEAEKCFYINNGKMIYKNLDEEEDICSINQIKVKGAHNLSNVLSAIAVVKTSFNVKKMEIKEALLNFKKVAHRMEFVRKINNARYYNDTSATIPQATIAAINSFLQPIHLICGGSSKKLDMNNLAKKISQEENIKKVFLLSGTATESLRKLIIENGGADKIEDVYDNLEDAVAKARISFEDKNYTKGVILFSPGCASFGMFKNEFDRGEKFIKIVNEL